MKKIVFTFLFSMSLFDIYSEDKVVEKVKKDFLIGEFYCDQDSQRLPCGLYFAEKSYPQITCNYNSSNSLAFPEVAVTQETKTNQDNEQTSKLASEQVNAIQTMFDQLTKIHAMQEGLSNKVDAIQNQQGQSQTTGVTTDFAVTSVLHAKQVTDFLQQSLISLEKSFDWLQTNSIIFAGTGLATLYSYTMYIIYENNRLLDDPCAFACWQNNKSLEELLATPVVQLESDLLDFFYHRYVDPSHPLDGNYALIQSSLALDKEIEVVVQQISLYQWIIACRCSSIFFIDKTKLVDLQNKQKKLLFMKHVFRSWCAKTNVEKHSKKDTF